MHDRRPSVAVDPLKDFCRLNDQLARDIRRRLREAEDEGIYVSVPAGRESNDR
jgi:hypothetical protein